MTTYQDWLEASDRLTFILDAIENYKSSAEYRKAIEAESYFKAENIGINTRPKWTMKKSGKTITFSKNITISNFFFRFVVQQNQFLLSNGLQTKDQATKAKLGYGFDKTLESIGERALIHGTSWGFWNYDRLEKFDATQFFALLDERSSEPMVGIRFWQIAPEKPMYVQVYEFDGITEFVTASKGKGELTISMPKTAYKQTIRSDILGSEIIGGDNYSGLPIIPLYANEYHRSEFTDSIKTKIDMYDKIFSDFGDNLERTNDIYWVIKNYGGIEARELLAEIAEYQAVITGEGDNATAEPHTIDVPYEARKVALDALTKALYSDYMALNMDEIQGGSLTNVAIQVAITNLQLKANRFEWQVFQFCQKVLALAGVDTENIKFRRQEIANKQEIMNMLMQCREDLDLQTALEKNPLVEMDEIPMIMGRLAMEDLGMPEEPTEPEPPPVEE